MKNLGKFAATAALAILLSTGAYAHGDCGTEETHEQSQTNAAPIKIGALELTNARARAMLDGQKVGGGYVTIKNTIDKADRLISVSSSRAARMEVHEMTMDDGVMKMRKLSEGLPVAAGETISLQPSGNHLMFFGIEKPFKEGEVIPVEFTFEQAGKVIIDLVTTPAANAKETAKEKKQH